MEVTSFQSKDLFVSPGNYYLHRNSGNSAIDASKDIEFPIMLDATLKNYALSTNQVAEFGLLVVHVSTVDDMPKQSITTRWYVASDYGQTSTASSNSTGYSTFNLAPDIYDIVTYSAVGQTLGIMNSSVVITGGATTIIEISLSHLQVYTVGNQYTSLYVGPTNHYNSYSGIDPVLDIYVPEGYNYTVVVDSTVTYTNIVPGVRERVPVGVKVQIAPTWITHTNDGRVLADQSTLIHLRAQDLNYDDLTFYALTNFGSLTYSTPRWYADSSWGVDINFTAPSSDDFYQIQFGVEDTDGMFTNFTDFLSNRQSSVNLRNAGRDYRSLNGYNTIVGKFSGSTVAGGYAGSDGNSSYSIYDGVYSISWQMDSIFYYRDIKIDANIGFYYFQFNYTEITFNITAEWGNPVNLNLRAYNQTDNLVTSVALISSGVGGIATMIIAPYSTYAFQAVGTNNHWIYDYAASPAVEQFIDIKFGGLAVYSFNGGNPINTYLYLYNGTSNALIISGYSGGDGIILYRVIPYSNYTIWDYTTNIWYTNLTVVENVGLVVGNFTNTAPQISSINTSPGNVKLNPGQNVTVTVVASDSDPIDTLDYSWSANVGSFVGSGPSVLYIAPGTSQQYKVMVTVSDQFGGSASTYLYVSNRVSTVNINITKSDGAPYNGYVNIFRTRDSGSVASNYVGTDGLITYSNIYDEEYIVRGDTLFGTTIDYPFIPDQSSYNFDFDFAELVLNATTGNGLGFSATFKLRNNTSLAQLTAVGTGGTGYLNSVIVAPGTFTLEMLGTNSVWKYDVSIVAHEKQTHEFHFAQIELNATTGYGNPQNFYAYIRDPFGTSIQSSYIGADGIIQYNVAPGNYTTEVADSQSIFEYNIIVTENQYYQSKLSYGRLLVYVNDGVIPLSQTARMLLPNTSTILQTVGSGAGGISQFNAAPGVYDITVNSVLLYEDVVIGSNERIELGTRLNTAPVISSVVASPARISTDSSTTITVTITDVDYDYPNLVLSASPNVGTIAGLMAQHRFTAANVFIITFSYNSPSLLSLFQIDITVSDGDDVDTYTLYVSDVNNVVNLYSYRAGNTPQSSTVRFYEYQTGTQYTSTSTSGTTGTIQINIPDGKYNVRFDEVNYIYFRNLLIYGGQILNLTAYFGEVTIFSSGAGGVPLNSYVYVRNATDSSIVVSGYTGGDGLSSYILAPGNYNVEVQQATSIFFGITIEGGQEAVVGSEVPQLQTQPADVEYYQGETGNNVMWNFTDSNPAWYVIYRDNVQYEVVLWDGSPITLDLDGLGPGIYEFRIFVNDTYGYYNVDTIFLTVNGPILGPNISGMSDFTTQVETAISIQWFVDGTYEDTYQILRDGSEVVTGVWFDGTYVTFDDNNLLPGLHSYQLIIYNDFGTQQSYTVFVTVADPPTPMVTGPTTTTIYLGTHSAFTWNMTSDYQANYSLVANGVVLQSGDWITTNSIYLEFDLALGTHTFTLYVSNIYGGTNSWVFTITAVDLPVPRIASDIDSTLEVDESKSLVWTISGTDGATYELYQNGVLIADGSWSDGEQVTYLHSNRPIGTYNYTLSVSNTLGITVTSMVIITVVDTTIPLSFVSTPGDYVLGVGSDTLTLYWVVDGNDENEYTLSLNGSVLFTSGWTQLQTVLYDASGLLSTPGTYVLEITFTNTRGESIHDSVTITVISGEKSNNSDSPGITFLSLVLVLGLGVMISRKRRVN